jgi:GT2 family glycosyltransferase
LASLVVCSRNEKLLRRLLTSVRNRTQYTERQIVVVHHAAAGQDGIKHLLSTMDDVKLVRYEGPFHFSRMNNLGAAAAAGDVLVFLNDDIEPLEASWLERLVAHCQRPDVGVVGAKLLYPTGALQHAGMAIAINDGCGHPGRGAYTTPYWKWTDMTRDVSAVTGACLALKRDLFNTLGGFDDAFPMNYNDVDLCLRARRAGYRVLLEARAILRHYECATRQGGVAAWERERWCRRWSAELDRSDPFYSPNLSRMSEDASLRSE